MRDLLHGLLNSMRRLPGTKARETLDDLSADIEIRRIKLDLDVGGREPIMTVAYELGANPSDRRPLVLGWRHKPLTPHSVQVHPARLPDRASHMGARDSAATLVSLPVGASWADTTLRFAARVDFDSPLTRSAPTPDGEATRFFLVPAFLPSIPKTTRSGERQPSIDIDPLPAGFAYAGIRHSATSQRSRSEADLVRSVLFPVRDGVQPIPLDTPEPVDLVIGGSGASGLDLARRTGLALLWSRMITFLTDSFDRPIAGRVAILIGSENHLPLEPGVCIVGRPDWLGLAPRSVRAFEPDIVAQLSYMWIGSGCGVVGEWGSTLGMGIGSGFGLHWLRSQGDSEYLASALVNLRRAATARGSSRLQPTSPEDRNRYSASVALAVAAALADGDAMSNALQLFVREYWGRFVDQAVLLHCLASGGAELDQTALM